MTDKPITHALVGAVMAILLYPVLGWWALLFVLFMGAIKAMVDDPTDGVLDGVEFYATATGGSVACLLFWAVELFVKDV